MMQCPRCKMNDVYLSSSGNANVISFITKSVRCHRCCHLFKVPRWVHVPEKNESDSFAKPLEPNRRAG